MLSYYAGVLYGELYGRAYIIRLLASGAQAQMADASGFRKQADTPAEVKGGS